MDARGGEAHSGRASVGGGEEGVTWSSLMSLESVYSLEVAFVGMLAGNSPPMHINTAMIGQR